MGSILKHNKILSATIILTAAGIIARCLGFVNRIFLSQLIGAKELGIYQMITPVSMLVYSLTTHGITTSLTKLTAKLFAKENFSDSKKLLKKAIILTLFLSFAAFVIVYFKADFICTNILGASMLTDCLKLLSFSFFPIALKGCILAYFLGMENSKIHAVSQLMEQCFRVGCIFFFAYYIPSISHNVLLAVYGLVVGEYTSFLFTYFYYVKSRKKKNLLFFKKNNIDNNKNSEKNLDKISHNDSNKIHTKEPDLKKISYAKENSYGFRVLISQSIPITTNRFIITLFTSIEAVIIPKMLLLYFHDYQTAMVEYGCLTGMALPFLLFPATITNSLALILLPIVSKEASLRKTKKLQKITNYCTFSCLFFGIFCTIFFYVTGPYLGKFVFHNINSGTMIRQLSFLCPLLYLSSTTGSILNGLNRMTSSLLYHLLSIGLRTFIILIFVPSFGIPAYIIGMLSSTFLHNLLQYIDIRNTIKKLEDSFI